MARRITIQTIDKWKRDNKELELAQWLQPIENSQKEIIGMNCKACLEYEDAIVGMRYFTPEWSSAVGCNNFRLSAVKGHAESNVHARALELYRRHVLHEKNVQSTSIQKVFEKATMSGAEQTRLIRKMSVSYFMAKNNIAFRLYPDMLKLLVTDGKLNQTLDIGRAYTNPGACAEFTDFNAKALLNITGQEVASCNFLSVLMDGCTIHMKEKELIYVNYFAESRFVAGGDPTRLQFIALQEPKSANAVGLKDCLNEGIQILDQHISLEMFKSKAVSMCTDGASVNLGARNGLGALLRQDMPWMLSLWCICHRLELAIKDAFKYTVLTEIQDMLMRLHYLYKNSPKKLRSLTELAEAYTLAHRETDESEIDILGGKSVQPVKSKGTRWIGHVWLAMKRAIANFGIYLIDIESFACTSKGADQARLRGYLNKWKKFKLLIGMGFFLHLLEPIRNLSLLWQKKNGVTIVEVVSGLKKAKEDIDAVKQICQNNDCLSLPYIKTILDKTKDDKYQDYKFGSIYLGKHFVTSHAIEWCDVLIKCLDDRFRGGQDQELLDCMCRLLNTKEWGILMDTNIQTETASTSTTKDTTGFLIMDKTIKTITKQFEKPLIEADCQIQLVASELKSLHTYATEVMDINSLHYLEIWRKMFMVNKSGGVDRWGNILKVVELCFAMPLSNARLESFFSQMRRVETDWRGNLSAMRLASLLRITLEGQEYGEYDAKPATVLFSNSKLRRASEIERRPYKPTVKMSEKRKAQVQTQLDTLWKKTKDNIDE